MNLMSSQMGSNAFYVVEQRKWLGQILGFLSKGPPISVINNPTGAGGTPATDAEAVGNTEADVVGAKYGLQ